MFREIIVSAAVIWWLVLPIGIISLLTLGLCVLWRKQANAVTAGITYPLETFRGPIDTGVSSAGILIPLVAALIAYLTAEEVPVAQMVPLGSSLFLLVGSVLVGLFNMFGMTSSQDDKITITKTNLTYFVPVFVLQLLLTAAALIVLLVYFLTAFKLPEAARPVFNPASPVIIARPALRVGMEQKTVLMAWGTAGRIETNTNEIVWHYDGPASNFEIWFRNGMVQRVTEKSK